MKTCKKQTIKAMFSVFPILHILVFCSENKITKKNDYQDWSSVTVVGMRPFVIHSIAGAEWYCIIQCKMDNPQP